MHNNLFSKEGVPFFEIFSRKPGFLISWALLIFAFIFSIIITVTWMIQCPEIVKARAILITKTNESAGYANIYIPQKELNKVKPGMPVQLHIDGYPYNEYGFVAATVQQIGDSVTDQGVVASLVLPSGLRTSKGKSISCSKGLKAEAVIVVREMRLLQRLFNKMSGLIRI